MDATYIIAKSIHVGYVSVVEISQNKLHINYNAFRIF